MKLSILLSLALATTFVVVSAPTALADECAGTIDINCTPCNQHYEDPDWPRQCLSKGGPCIVYVDTREHTDHLVKSPAAGSNIGCYRVLDPGH